MVQARQKTPVNERAACLLGSYFRGSLQITPEPTASRYQMTQLLKNIERQLEFVVIEKLAISGQECCTFLLIVRGRTGQSTSRALQQRFRNPPAFDQLRV
jgi:hypothetical protein